MGYTRNRKTEEKLIQNRKTANKIGENRKPHTKLYTQIGPNRKKKLGKTKNHIGHQNRKSASIFYENRKPDAKKTKNLQTALNAKTEKWKSFDTKTENPIKKISNTAKLKIPMPPP